MQQVSASLQAELNKGQSEPIQLIDLVEFYASDYVPGASGFDPDDAIERFAAETITWNGNAYRRELTEGSGRGDIIRNFGEKTNSVTLNFSNISRYMATLYQSQQIEGLFCVIRCVSPTVTDDSITLFVGRCDKPSDIDKGHFTLTARQDFGNINQEIPPRLFTADDPQGRSPDDPLYEGFRLTSQGGTFPFPVTTPSTSFFGRLLGKQKHSIETRQWSSTNDTPYGSAVQMIFGRCQMELVPILFTDAGYNDFGVWVVGEGRVDTFTDLKIRDDRFLLQTQDDHYGDLGGTGTNAVNTSTGGQVKQGYLSRTAYTIISFYGSAGDVIDEPPLVTALVRGTRVPTPDASGDFTVSAWSDNPVDIARYILTDSRLVGIDPGYMDDEVNYLTHLHCEESLIDDSNGEVTLIPAPDGDAAGEQFHRFRSTGVINARWYLYHKLGDTSVYPEFLDTDYELFDVDDVPTVFAIRRVLRRRYTVNVPVTDRVRAVDFLYRVIFPAAKLFLRVNKQGKYEIRSEVSADATMLRSATAVGATSIPILDVSPWKTGPELLRGRLLLGYGLTTSEVRNVSAAVYSTSGNSVTLNAAATGTITATRSGATLSGGSTTVRASGTVTIGGTPAPANTVTVTIDGIAITYTLDSDDTTSTVAAMVAAYINAQPQLRRYIVAEWLVASPTVITLYCKHGALSVGLGPDNAVAFWKMDEATGATRLDATGRGNSLTDHNSSAQIAGKIGNAVSFNGTNQYLSRATSADIEFGEIDWTVAFWVYPTQDGNYFFGKGTEYDFITTGLCFADFTAYDVNGDPALSFAYSTPMTKNAWNHVVVWRDVTAGRGYMQVNGGAIESDTWAGDVAAPSSSPLLFGTNGVGAFYPFRLDAVGFYKRILTAAERAELWNNGSGAEFPFHPLLKAHSGPIADPTAAPTAASSAGALAAGTYLLAYADVNALGQTALSPTLSIALAASKKIDVDALALVGTSRNWYLSDAPNSEHLKYVANTDGSAFSITALPVSTAPIPKLYNTTGEELIRVAMSFATNSQDIYPAWTPSTAVTASDIYLPSTPNGHKYSTSGGTTGTTEPTWPTTAGGTVSDNGMTWTEVGATVLGQTGLTRANIVKDSYRWPLNRQSSVNQIKGKYRDSNNDFALTPIIVNDPVHQAAVNKKYPLDVDLSAVDNQHQAVRLCNWLLAKNREGDWFNALETGPAGMVLEEGDVICASDDSGGLINQVTRIEEIRIRADHRVAITQARRYSTLMFADEVGADTIPVPTTLRFTQTVNSIAAFIDNFAIRDSDALISGFYISVSRDLATAGDWRGWVLHADYGDGYNEVARGDIPALVGTADTTLGSVSDPSIFDRSNTLDFTLLYGPPDDFDARFSTVTETELLSNPRRNLFLIGDEYVQAATIVANGNQSYTISTFLRGRMGTVNHTTHGADERVVFLDGSEVLVEIDPVRLNSEYNYKVVTTNQDVNDATAVPFTWTGGTLKCPPPSSLRGIRDADNNILILWNRRSRIAGGLRPFSDVPLGEEVEKYLVEITEATPPRTMVAITGMNLPAIMLGLDGTPAGTSKNSIENSGPAFTGRTAQIIEATGNFFEAEMAAGVSPSFESSQFGFIAPNANWTDTSNSNSAFDLLVLHTKSFSSPTFTSTFFIYERGVLTGTYNYDSDEGYLVKPRIRVLLQSGEFRVYLNWTGPSSVPIHVTAAAPRPAYTVGVHCSGTNDASLRSAIMTIAPQPAIVYSAAQNAEDGLVLTDPVHVSIKQVSAIVGPGEAAEGDVGGEGTVPPAFSPSDIAGLQLWLNAGSLALSDGDPVATWTDDSGNGNDATQSNASKKPVYKVSILNGEPIVRFDATDDFMSSAIVQAQPYTLFIVAKATNTGGNPYITDGGSTNESVFYVSDATHVDMYAGAGPPAGVTATPTVFSCYAVIFNGASSVISVNGTPTTVSASPGTGGLATGFHLMSNGNGTGNFPGGDVAEVLIYDSALSTDDREAVEAYLMDKYAL